MAKYLKRKSIFIILILILISGFLAGCGTMLRRNNNIVRPYEPTMLDVCNMVPSIGHSGGGGVPRGTFFYIFLFDFPFALLIDTIMLPKDLWDLQYNYQEHYDYLLSGKIIDSHGKLLDNVVVRIDGYRRTDIVYDFNIQNHNIERGEFQFELSNLKNVCFSFEKQGYYEKSFSIDPSEDTIFNNMLLKNKLLLSDWIIPLRKKDTFEELEKYEQYLTFSKNNKARVVSLLANLRAKFIEEEGRDNYEKMINIPRTENYYRLIDIEKDYIIEGEGDERDVFYVNNIRSGKLPPECIYFISDIDVTGNVATLKYYPDPEDKEYFNILPKQLILKCSSEESGFIPFISEKLPGEILDLDNSFQYMYKAPYEGYSNELMIDLRELEFNCKNIYFFFKIKDRYGKGCITSFDYEWSKKAGEDPDKFFILPQKPKGDLILKIELFINGTLNNRNLEAYNYD